MDTSLRICVFKIKNEKNILVLIQIITHYLNNEKVKGYAAATMKHRAKAIHNFMSYNEKLPCDRERVKRS